MPSNTVLSSGGGRVAHKPAKMERNIRDTYYVGKGYVSPFKCPACGRIVRAHLSYLGNRDLVCIGTKTIKEPRGKKLAFLICPVRGVDTSVSENICKRLEGEGFEVHYPPRDTNQNDPIGLQICKDNLQAIKAADIVVFSWDGKSQGCLFDLGMAFALRKRVECASELMPAYTSGKSFQNMVAEWERTGIGVEAISHE